ncbi:N-acetylmuramic acid 6-phosphate (MurNAc-6-P) etherase, partial [Bradyrhizobium sp. i1.15.2]
AEAMVAQIARCDPSHAAHWLEQAEGDIKTAGLLALGVDRVDAETILKNCDGNLRRVFAELAGDRDSHPDRHPKEAARKQGGAREP